MSLNGKQITFVVAHAQELTTYETLKQGNGCIISIDVSCYSSALVKSTTDVPRVFHDLSSNIGTNNIYVHIFMVPTYTWLKANSSSCPNVSRDFMPIAQRCNSPKKILLGLVYRAFTTIGFSMWKQKSPLHVVTSYISQDSIGSWIFCSMKPKI